MKTPRSFLALFFLFVALALTGAATATTITVNSTGDAAATDGQCTLREAINNANANSDTTGGDCAAGSGADTIQFNLGSGTPTITLASGLPSITDAVTIDGNSGTATRVEINGNGVSANGLFLDGNGNTIKNLVINRFAGDGITLNTSNSNTIQGNYIGTNAAGTTTAGFGNTGSGIRILASQSNTIGGTTGTTPGGSCTGVCNLISGNSGSAGIYLDGSGPFPSAASNTIQGNFIGLDVTGTVGRGNSYGIRTFNPGSNNLIGGTATGAGNVISGNANAGIYIGFSGSPNLVVQGNLIGTNSAGTASIGNSYGIEIQSGVFAQATVIGGSAAGAGNVISGNARSAIYGTIANGSIKGNFIGTDTTGRRNLQNGYYSGQGSALEGLGGISLNNGSTVNQIGGLAAGEPNVVAFNRGAGIRLGKDNFTTASGPSNPIRGNSIYLNDGLGISLRDGGGIAGTPLPNDTLDPDSGANSRQNRPVLSSVGENSGTITVNGTLNSLPTTSFLIDFYASENADASGFGEGQTYVGTTTVTTDANGDAAISFNYPAIHGQPFTAATATNPGTNDTSEFSNAILLQINPGTFVFSSATYSVAESAGIATITVNRANGSTGAACVNYATSDGTADSSDYTPVSGQFCFADGETSKTFTITIATDTVPEQHETVNLTLSNPTSGGALGFQSTATLTILNDDSFVSFVVNSTLDTDDGSCTPNAGGCTLREAINAANATTEQDSITFDIGTGNPTITVTSALPALNAPVILDGSSGPGAATRVEINGNNISGSGLTLNSGAGGSTIRRLVINRFNGKGIALSTSDNNVVEGNYIGTNSDGTAFSGFSNSQDGIYLFESQNNLIGGTTGTTPGGSCTGACNLISGNGGNNSGIYSDAFNRDSSGNVIAGNFIGTDVTGTAKLRNGQHGILLLNRSYNNVVGGTVPAARNLISGNSNTGIVLSSAAIHDNVIQGNYIGTNSAGTAKLGNKYGIALIADAHDNTIGGTAIGAGNVISGNGVAGIDFATVTGFGPVHDNLVQGNVIGTDPTGTLDLGNGLPGITVEPVGGVVIFVGAHDNTIGGTVPGAGNVIAFNYGAGVRVNGPGGSDAGAGNSILNNAIYSNDGLGITLNGHVGGRITSPLPNDAGDADAGANNGQNYPALNTPTSSGGTVTVTGTLNSVANTSFTIQFFASAAGDVTSPNGEGQTFIGSQTVTTDGSGNASIAFAFAPIFGRQFVTATATNNVTGDTSEFSAYVMDPTPQSNPPVVTASDASGNVNESITVNATFTDSDGTAPYTASIDCGNGNMATGVTINPPGANPGTVSGVCTYNTANNYTATVTVVDSAGVPGSDTAIVAVNGAPVAYDDATSTNEDSPVDGNLSATDTDSPNLTYIVVTNPTKGALTNFDSASGSFTYTPNANLNGPDSFTFKVNDGQADSNTATESITINAVNDAPGANSQSVMTNEDTAIGITLTGSDVEGDAIIFSVVTGPAHGDLTGTPPNLTYTPHANYNGSDSFTFRANDGQADSNIATVAITMDPVNDAPVANAQSVTMNEDASKAITLSATDPEGAAMSFSVVTSPAHGDLSGTPPNLTYTPHANYNGADSFTFKANDGQADSNVATVSITMDPVNDAPTADAQSVVTDEDTAKAIMLAGGDVDGDAITFTVVSQPAHGSLSGTPPNLTYTPAADYNGPDSFTFKSNDSHVDSNPATVSITVNSVNDAPVAAAQSLGTNEDTARPITLAATDTDGNTLTYSVVAGPAHGSLSGTPPNLTYTPAANYNGADSFSFKANDGQADSNTAIISISVAAVNDAPSFVKGPDQTVNQGAGPQSVPNWASNVSAGPADESGQALTFMLSTNNSALFATQPTVSSNGTLTYAPAPNANGSATVTVVLHDDGGTANTGQDTSAPQTFTISVVAPTPTPTPTPTPSPSASPSATASPSASPTASPTPRSIPTPTQALNISTRLRVGAGDKVMIAGFIITGNAPKPVIIRGMGPSLVASMVPSDQVLQDPVIELRDAAGALLSQNDNWKDNPLRSQIEAGTFAPADDHEAVIMTTLPPGVYTALLSGKGSTTGIGLVEVYDNDTSVDSSLANISTRGFVMIQDDVMIGGFMLGNNPTNTRIAIRGLGPSLTSSHLSNVLADPTLELHNENGTLLVANDNWHDDPVSAALLIANGLAPADSHEAAIFTMLPPGSFTAILAGQPPGTGIGLVEIYNLQ